MFFLQVKKLILVFFNAASFLFSCDAMAAKFIEIERKKMM